MIVKKTTFSSWLCNQAFLLSSTAFFLTQTPLSVHSFFFCSTNRPTITRDGAMGNETFYWHGLSWASEQLHCWRTCLSSHYKIDFILHYFVQGISIFCWKESYYSKVLGCYWPGEQNSPKSNSAAFLWPVSSLSLARISLQVICWDRQEKYRSDLFQ